MSKETKAVWSINLFMTELCYLLFFSLSLSLWLQAVCSRKSVETVWYHEVLALLSTYIGKVWFCVKKKKKFCHMKAFVLLLLMYSLFCLFFLCMFNVVTGNLADGPENS